MSIGQNQNKADVRYRNLTVSDTLVAGRAMIDSINVSLVNINDLVVNSHAQIERLNVVHTTHTHDLVVDNLSQTLNLDVTATTNTGDLNVTNTTTTNDLHVTADTTTATLEVSGTAAAHDLHVTADITASTIEVSGTAAAHDLHVTQNITAGGSVDAQSVILNDRVLLTALGSDYNVVFPPTSGVVGDVML